MFGQYKYVCYSLYDNLSDILYDIQIHINPKAYM